MNQNEIWFQLNFYEKNIEKQKSYSISTNFFFRPSLQQIPVRGRWEQRALKEGGLRRVHKLQIDILGDENYPLPEAIARQKKN